MKWSEIRNNVKNSVQKVTEIPHQVREKQDLPIEGSMKEKQRKFLVITGIFLVIIVAAIVVFVMIKKDKQSQNFINQEQAQFIENFLGENNPEPITTEQETAIQDLLESDFSGFETTE